MQLSPAMARLGDWRPSPSFRSVLLWAILPNLAFLPLLIIGGPLRTFPMVMYVLIGMAARRLPFGVLCAALVAMVSIDAIYTISRIFNLTPVSLFWAVRYIPNLDVFSSAEFIFMGATLVATTAAILLVHARSRPLLNRVSMTPALIFVAALVAGDVSANLSVEYYYGRYLQDVAPFDSAGRRSGFSAALAAPDGRNVLVVVVEGMGRFSDDAHRALLTAPFRREGLADRYEITTGSAPYYGSTTSAEVRELCGRWGDYRDFLERRDASCLPARLAAAGYRTTGIHSFSGDMFERRTLYPNLGIQRLLFAEEMYAPGDRLCVGVFTGLCDVDVARYVEDSLRGDGRQPQFVHWLTLNSHLPITEHRDGGPLGCTTDGGPFGHRAVCTIASMWHDVFERVITMAMARDLPTTDILIVGDHAPPFWNHRARGLFEPGQVTWIHLRDRRPPPHRTASTD